MGSGLRSRRKDQGQCSASVFRCSRPRQRFDVYPISVMSRMESCGADMFVSGDVVSCFTDVHLLLRERMRRKGKEMFTRSWHSVQQASSFSCLRPLACFIIFVL